MIYEFNLYLTCYYKFEVEQIFLGSEQRKTHGARVLAERRRFETGPETVLKGGNSCWYGVIPHRSILFFFSYFDKSLTSRNTAIQLTIG